jgi:hypothetical protein
VNYVVGAWCLIGSRTGPLQCEQLGAFFFMAAFPGRIVADIGLRGAVLLY